MLGRYGFTHKPLAECLYVGVFPSEQVSYSFYLPVNKEDHLLNKTSFCFFHPWFCDAGAMLLAVVCANAPNSSLDYPAFMGDAVWGFPCSTG